MASHGAGVGASMPTKGCPLGSKTGPAARATAAPRLYSPYPISPILASPRCPITGASEGVPGTAAPGARHTIRNEEATLPRGLGGVKPTGNGARRSAHPHGREKPPPGTLISRTQLWALLTPVMPGRCFSCLDLAESTGNGPSPGGAAALRIGRRGKSGHGCNPFPAGRRGGGGGALGRAGGLREQHPLPGMENLEKSGRVWEKATVLPALGLDMPLERGEDALPLTVA